MKDTPKRRRRDQRRENPSPMQLRERDVDIIEAVHKYRVLRQEQIQALFFGSRATAQTRLEKLYDHAYLDRKFLPVYEGQGRSPTLYVLDRRGAETLRVQRGYDAITWHSSSKNLATDFLQHTTAINEVMIAVTLACRAHGFILEEWQTESHLKADYDRVRIRSGRGQETAPVIPDSYFTIIANQRRYPFALELDRGTMELKRFKTKVKAYMAYHQSGSYERRFGTSSLRVLTVVSTEAPSGGEQRRDNLKETSAAAGGAHWFWFAVLPDLNAETILAQPVWSQVGEAEPKALIPVHNLG